MQNNNFRFNRRNSRSRPVLTNVQAARGAELSKKAARTIQEGLGMDLAMEHGIGDKTIYPVVRRTRYSGHLYVTNPVFVVNEGGYGKSYGIVIADANRKLLGGKPASGAWFRPAQKNTFGLRGDALTEAKEKNDQTMSSFCEAMANVSPDTLLEFGGFEYYTVLVTDGTSEHTLLVAEVYSAIGDGIAWTSRVHPDETPDDDESQGAEDEEPAMEILS